MDVRGETKRQDKVQSNQSMGGATFVPGEVIGRVSRRVLDAVPRRAEGGGSEHAGQEGQPEGDPVAHVVEPLSSHPAPPGNRMIEDEILVSAEKSIANSQRTAKEFGLLEKQLFRNDLRKNLDHFLYCRSQSNHQRVNTASSVAQIDLFSFLVL